MTSPSELFDFLAGHEALVIDRFEISFTPFENLRKDVCLLFLRLRESDAIDVSVSTNLRTAIFRSLTMPLHFSDTHQEVMAALGDSPGTTSRWSPEMARLCDSVRASAEVLGPLENPLRTSLAEIIQELRATRQSFKILCHRRAVPTFESLPIPCPPSLSDGEFLHTMADYRDSDLFDVLVKVGPLRSSGWGAAPDAVLTAPHFDRLAQLVWNGCADEPGFGYDPALMQPNALPNSPDRAPSGVLLWTRRQKQVTHESPMPVAVTLPVDELNEFSKEKKLRDIRTAVLLKLDRQRGLLCLPSCQILSFDAEPTAVEPIAHRIPTESLVAGMYLIIPDVDEIDLGSVRAQPGRYSHVWRDLLLAHSGPARVQLVTQLAAGGLDLYALSAAVENWCRPPDTVIHAPRKVKHFQILIRALGLWDRLETMPDGQSIPFWKLAWQEIRSARGDAIQAGFQEHEFVDEELQEIATSMLPDIQRQAEVQSSFELQLPQPNDITGAFRFYRVSGIEEGFSAPDSELRLVRALDEFEQWRS